MPTSLVPAGLPSAGLALLLDAFDIADDSDLSIWEVAVKWRKLRKAGCSDAGLQWLIAKKYAEHALETTLPFDALLTFRPMIPPWFHRRDRVLSVGRRAIVTSPHM